MRIAVTGASGFIGGAVVRALTQQGHEVEGFARSPGYTYWDIAAGPRPGEADAVVHCAALTDDWGDSARLWRTNMVGTQNVIASYPGARFVHLSTSSVYDGVAASVQTRESDAPTGWLSDYSQTKALSETLFADLDAAILRPHAVYGPGDTTLMPRVLAGIRMKRLVLPEGGRVLHTLTHIDNLVTAVELALTSTARGAFNIGDAGDVLLCDALRQLLDAQGRVDVALKSIPYDTAFRAAAALEKLHHRFGGRPRLTRYAVSQLGLERTFDLTRARDELGFEPFATTFEGAENWR